ncbi:SixA phosphatase family protein [Pontiella sulfatireligans]|uniref:2,3-bisphosphoglycerate-dependent phosphoglycerate mutase n=1 Tax=Pontiella sulfatireligans TaxID=2750658 RepID=A0A6C2UIW5_9BACT|nr:histidine phosphatase family protein [Pontiella sulfatireligans]VGO19823.1 hypothetical protein SCARR_01883 [Pontiella sulfatireligans]
MTDGKPLYLVRHAKSDWHTGVDDFDRPLNKRGRRDAPEMGRRLKMRGVEPDIMVCSPAKRALETLELLNVPAQTLVYDETIYEASLSTLLEIVQSLDDGFDSAMLVGHNPGMSWLASQLSGVRIKNMPTCSIAAIRLDTHRWKAAGVCPGELADFDYPKKPS